MAGRPASARTRRRRPNSEPMIDPGRPMARSAAEITATASDSAAPGATLKLMVAAGNCSSCVIVSGAVVRSSWRSR